MKVFCYAGWLDGYYQHLLNSMHKAGLEYVVHVEGQRTWEWRKMVDFQEAMAAQYPDELMIFIDLWDCLFVGDPKEMEEQIASMPVTLQSAKTYWPDVGREDEFPDVGTPWRYVNGAGPFGRGKELLEVIRYGKARYPIRPMDRSRHPHDFPANDNDQRFYTDLYLDGKAALDFRCEIVQCLPRIKSGELEYRDGRIHNLVTGTKPHFLHAANRTWDIIPEQVIRDKSLRLN